MAALMLMILKVEGAVLPCLFTDAHPTSVEGWDPVMWLACLFLQASSFHFLLLWAVPVQVLLSFLALGELSL